MRMQKAQPFFTLALVIVAAIWFSSTGYRQDLAVLTATYALLALGMYLPFILGNRLSLAYNAYLGIGAYSVGLIGTKTQWPLLFAIPIAMVLSAILAVALGFVTRRLSGFYLAAVTLLFGVAFEAWLGDADSVTGGAAGIGSIPALTLFGQPVDRTAFVIAALLLIWLIAQGLGQLRRSPFGIAVRAQREAPDMVEAMGVPVPALGLVTLAVGAAITSVGGALFALVNRAVLPETFTMTLVFFALFMPLLGGRSSPWGAVIGAVLVTYFTFGLELFEDAGLLTFSLAVLLVLLIAPQGLLGLFSKGYRLVASRIGGAR
jgi:branched-chain amino acid transport system permease protein